MSFGSLAGLVHCEGFSCLHSGRVSRWQLCVQHAVTVRRARYFQVFDAMLAAGFGLVSG